MQRLSRGRVVDALNGKISPYDKLVRKYSDRYGFDWRLVTAQMYQESKFNPKAKSQVGARGLMQLMPRTAKAMGVINTSDPAHSIKGGVKYLDWLRDRFDTSLPISERLWFSLAAYNAGAGHVQDARRLASQMGYDANRWFEHTENAMLLLSKKKYAKKARYGFVNGTEPVNYVRDIRQRFEAYIELSGKIARNQKAPPQQYIGASCHPGPRAGRSDVSVLQCWRVTRSRLRGDDDLWCHSRANGNLITRRCYKAPAFAGMTG